MQTIAVMDSHYLANGSYRNNGMGRSKSSRYSGSMYTMAGSGAQVLMNAHTIVTATSVQFLPPIRTKTTMCSATSSTTPAFIGALNFNDTKMPSSQYIASTPAVSAAAVAAAGIQTKFETKTESYPMLSAIKGFFSSLLRPIISTANTLQYIPITTENNGGFATSNGKFHETSTNVYMNVMPADMETSTFFDCDDYVDSEDTVDFIAGTTPKFDEFPYERLSTLGDASPKSSAYFDCISTFAEKSIENSTLSDSTVDDKQMEDAIVIEACSPPQEVSVDCGVEKTIDKPIISYRSKNRKHKRNRRPNRAIHRSAKSLVAHKNRNEKHRNEIAQIIHDDIECIHEGQDDDSDSDLDSTR